MRTANELSRKVRQPSYVAPGANSEPPPAFLTVPVTVARKAVSLYHSEGEATARTYLQASKVGEWSHHANPSMATSNTNVLTGFDAYVAADSADGRSTASLSQQITLDWPAGPLKVRIDVVLTDGDGLAGRAVFWDGPGLAEDQAGLIAAPYANALEQLYPDSTLTSIGIWQARRQIRVEVPLNLAKRKIKTAQRLQFSL